MQVILNQLVYFGFFQSLFLLFIFLFSRKRRKQINGFLAFFVLVLTIGLSGKIVHMSGIFGQNFRFIVFSEFATLLFGSTIYLFTRSVLKGENYTRKDLIHYLPAFFYILFAIFVFIAPSDEVSAARLASGELFRTITIFVGVGLAFNFTYWFMSLDLFLTQRKQLNNELSYEVKTRFFLNFLIAIGICLLSWLTVYLISIFGYEMLERNARKVIWLSIALIILFIAFYALKEPELFKVAPLTHKKYSGSKLTINELDRLKEKLTALMEQKKPYLNNKLLKAELAEMLGINNAELARLLNENIGMNFFEYVNYYRIKEFVELAKTEQGKRLTFFGLAQEAGFNSKTTFNKSFKKLMGTTPREYFSGEAL